MAISKKGTRKITVEGIDFIYKISKIKQKSNQWRRQKNELDDNFIKHANYYGLGSVKDVTINIVVQLEKNPVSNIYIKIQTILVDGFMGPGQLIQITPKLVSKLIIRCLKNGWEPSKKDNYELNILEKYSKDDTPKLFEGSK